jgi:hypothetical protein
MKRLAVTALAHTICFATLGAAKEATKETAKRPTGASMAEAAQQFISSLADDQRAKAMMKFSDPARLDWHNIPKPQRKGVQLRDLTAEQREHAHALLRVSLSESGYDKAVKIMALENNLHEGEKLLDNGPGHLRDPLRFFLTTFGQPAASAEWGWSFEGHHLSLNFVIRDGVVVADSPSFWGANPATVHTFIAGGPEVGTRTLADEEQLAFDLLNSLDNAQRAKAVIADKAPGDYRAAGRPEPPRTPPAGLPANEMTASQKQTLRELLAAYLGHLADDVAAARLQEIDDEGIEKVHFAWQGAQKPGIGHAYRVQGPTFLLELVNIQSDPAGNPANHIHSVWRSLEGDFGVSGSP